VQARASARSTAGSLQPTLSGSLGAGYGESRSDGQTSGNDSWSADLSSSYTIYDGGANRARVESAKWRVRKSELTLGSEAARLGADLSRAFTRLAFAQQQVVLLENISERRGQNRDLVQLRYEGGKENLGSALRSRAVYGQALQDATSALRSLAVAQRELAVALGRPVSDELLADGFAPAAEVAMQPDFEALARMVPEVRQAEADLILARSDVIVARSAFRPEWSANLSAGRSGDDPGMENSSWRAGLGVSYPFYRGRRDTYDLAAAQSAEREAALRLEQQRQAAHLDLQQAWSEASDASEQQAVQRAFLEAAEVRAEIARAQYASGLIGFQDWDQIEDEIINARKALLASQRDATLAAAAWLQAQGLSPLEVP
jgi:outer membrane protein TolC